MTIKMDANTYDTLHFSALAFGGIGARKYFEEEDKPGRLKEDCPVCIHGHAYVAFDASWRQHGDADIADRRLSRRYGITVSRNDAAIHAINERKGCDLYARVSWEDYTKELDIVRKESK